MCVWLHVITIIHSYHIYLASCHVIDGQTWSIPRNKVSKYFVNIFSIRLHKKYLVRTVHISTIQESTWKRVYTYICIFIQPIYIYIYTYVGGLHSKLHNTIDSITFSTCNFFLDSSVAGLYGTRVLLYLPAVMSSTYNYNNIIKLAYIVIKYCN